MREKVIVRRPTCGRRLVVRRGRWPSAAWIVAVLAPVLCGCSIGAKPTARLQGTVTIGGAPLSDQATGGLTFKPARSEQGKEVFARIEKGRYDSPNTPKGPVKVYFSISQPSGKATRSERTGEMYQEMENVVPPKYGAGVDLEVSGDKSDQNFDLESK